MKPIQEFERAYEAFSSGDPWDSDRILELAALGLETLRAYEAGARIVRFDIEEPETPVCKIVKQLRGE